MSPLRATRSPLLKSIRWALGLVAAALALWMGALDVPGCAPDPSELESAGTSAQDILNGTSLAADNSGIVEVFGATVTTGVLLRNDWVMSTQPGNLLASGQVGATVVMGSQTTSVDAVVTSPNFSSGLYHLSTPLSMNGSTTSWDTTQLWSNTDASLMGTTVQCFSYGNSTPTGGSGTLREALLPVVSSGVGLYTLGTNASGQSMTSNDPGAPCFQGSYLTGIQVGANQTGVSDVRAWVLDTIGESSPPSNDTRANAAMLISVGSLSRASTEVTAAGSTANATHDGPSGSTTCTSGNDVWFHFSPYATGAVSFDTAGSSFDTSIVVTDSAGNPVAGMSNDDAHCTTGGFTSTLQSQVAGMLLGGEQYYVVVGGCGSGKFFLHYQQFPTVNQLVYGSLASYFYDAQFSGNGTTSTYLVGSSQNSSSCGGAASGEDARWFVTCGGLPQFFSTCQSDGGAWSRQIGTTEYDPVMYIMSGHTGGYTVCNDDAVLAPGDNCSGTGGDTVPWGARLSNVIVPRGLNALFVDSNSGGSGMTYTLRYAIR